MTNSSELVQLAKNLSNSTNYIIFDFDGVLADSLNSMAHGMKKRWSKMKLLPIGLIKKMIVDYVDKPSHSRKNKLTPDQEAQIIKDYQLVSKEIIAQNRTKIFEGFVIELKKLIQVKKCKLAIVSSGSEIYINFVLRQIDLPFEYVYGAETSLSKEHKVEIVCQNWSIELKDCMYFTDSKTDIIELNHILDLKQIFGCSWGWQGFEKLNQILPENQIFKEYKDIWKIF